MLLGIDFMHACKAKLDLEDGTLSLDGDRIVMSCGRSQPSREVHETYLCVLCLDWHPSNLSGGGRSGFLRTQESLCPLIRRIVKAHCPSSEVGPISWEW